MAIFELQRVWHAAAGESEEFDPYCVSISNIDNLSPLEDRIIVGSLQGILRIFNPQSPDFSPADLVLEEDLQAPILQIGNGRLISADSSLKCLVVLHPRKFKVFLVEPGSTGQQSNAQSRPSYYRLTLQYEHRLGLQGEHFSAFNMLISPLGGSERLDIIVIQAVDGKLQVFEREAEVAFSRQLPNCLIPGPLCFLPKLDSIVTASSQCRLECYRYGVLSNLSNSTSTSKSATNDHQAPFLSKHHAQHDIPLASTDNGLVKHRSVLSEWSLSLGEMIIDVKTGRFSSSLPSTQSELIVMGQHSLFLVRDNGVIESQLRLMNESLFLSIYSSNQSQDNRLVSHNILILTKSKMIHVYRDMKLIWLVQACDIACPLVVLSSSSFKLVNNSIVVMGQSGELSVNVLGSRPVDVGQLVSSKKTSTSTTNAGTESKSNGSISSGDNTLVADSNFDEMDEEYRKCSQLIREYEIGKTDDASSISLRIQVHVPSLINHGRSALPPSVISLADVVGEQEGISDEFETLLVRLSSSSSSCLCVSVRLTLSANYLGAMTDVDPSLTNIRLHITCPNFVVCSMSDFTIPTLSSRTSSVPVVRTIRFFVLNNKVPTSLTCVVSSSFVNTIKNQVECSECRFDLPFSLVCRLKSPQKTAKYKLTLATNRDACQLLGLFNDLVLNAAPFLNSNIEMADGSMMDDLSSPQSRAESKLDQNDQVPSDDLMKKVVEVVGSAVSANSAIGLALWFTDSSQQPLEQVQEGRNILSTIVQPQVTAQEQQNSAVVTILASKTGGKYRIQSDSLSAMWIVVHEVEKRLRLLYQDYDGKRDSRSDFEVTIADDVPLEDLFQVIEVHFGCRINLFNALADINDLAQQYRAFQKRLLIRFKDKTCMSLDRLDFLLQKTYDALIARSDVVSLLQGRAVFLGDCLVCICKLIVRIMKLRYSVAASDCELLERHLCPILPDDNEIGWEECVDTSMQYLLKTSLAKSSKETVTLSNSVMSMPQDVSKLRKHITIVFDRVSKGGRLISSSESKSPK